MCGFAAFAEGMSAVCGFGSLHRRGPK
jgi:hypothetical protein